MSDDISRKVDRLLKEREKYEGWLARLESQKKKTTEQAYDRVRKDYQDRLAKVVNELHSHADELRSRLQEMETAVVEREAERTARAEELDEARLRHSVGEYPDDKEWAALEKRLLRSVRDTEKELKGLRDDISKLKEIVALVETPEAGAPKPKVKPAKAKVSKKKKAAAPKTAAEPVAAGAAEPEAGGDEDYLSLGELVAEEFEQSGIEIEPATGRAKSSKKTAAKKAAEPAAAEPAAAEPSGVGDELAFLESLSLGDGEEAKSFNFLAEHGSGTPQTIVCPHCSAGNDPAEWYCTECGEELPAE